MTERVQSIIEHIVLDNEESVSRALVQTRKLTKLTVEEKNELTAALTTVFYHHDHAGITGMTKVAVMAEKQIAKFGCEVVPFLIEELINADAESAAYLGRAIALNGCQAIDFILGAWDENWEDDFASINIIQALSYFKTAEIKKAIPRILVASKSANFQVRAIALYAIGKIARRITAEAFDDSLRNAMFDAVFESLADRKPLVRKNAARTLGKMQKKGILIAEHEKKVFMAFKAILGTDGRHKWDRAFIVRHEAEHFLPFFKIDKTLADKYRQSFRIITKRELAPDTFHYNIEAPLIARKLQAGQFIIVRPHETSERIPLSVCGWDADKGTVQIIIMSVGKTSTQINHMNVGDTFLDVVGPLGERSRVKKHKGTCVVIGGGYGTGAIIPTARNLKALGNRVVGIVGARTSNLLLMMDEIREVCDEVIATTNDGSEGKKGFVTNALGDIMKYERVSHVLAVGPVPMMKAVSDMTRPADIETYVSLNAIMVDGTGMCGACRVSIGGKTKFACFHGPDFDGHQVDFQQLMKRQKMFVKEEQDAFEALDL
jgi:ferredoxin--NADP+ reductase